MPGMGKEGSASVAASFRMNFPNIRISLVVGICGGVPQPEGHHEIFLGDVIISTGLIQFDFGRQYSNKVIPKDTLQDSLGKHNKEIGAFLNKIQGWRACRQLRQYMAEHITEICNTEGFEGSTCPGPEEDKLYQAGYRHKHQDPTICTICAQCTRAEDAVCDAALNSSCTQLWCNNGQLVTRERP
jgi:hypothetical protein